jgi:hypothetical protein
MRRKEFALAFVLTLLTSTLPVHLATADPFMAKGTYSGEPTPISINIQSPSEKITYWIGSDVWLDFTVKKPVTWWYDTITNITYMGSIGTLTKVGYVLDNLPQKDTNKVSKNEGVDTFSVNLGRLTSGQHTLIINVEGLGYFGNLNLTRDIHLGSNYSMHDQLKTKPVNCSVSINFDVAAFRPTTSPNITLLSPTNKTYYYISDWSSIPYVRLEYKSDDTHLSVWYRLDWGKYLIAVTNESKIEIPIQSRSLTLYANDSFGNSAIPQTTYYEIERYVEPNNGLPLPRNASMPYSNLTIPNTNQTSSQDPFHTESTLPISAAAMLIAVIGFFASAGLIVYLKKHKGKDNSTCQLRIGQANVFFLKTKNKRNTSTAMTVFYGCQKK